MGKYDALKISILEDGIIDQEEVSLLRNLLYEDGIIDIDEAEFLFELNDAVSGKPNHESWKTLFVDAITSFLLDDETSPGEIDQKEEDWLISKIQGDGKVDEIESALLDNLIKQSKNIPISLKTLFNK